MPDPKILLDLVFSGHILKLAVFFIHAGYPANEG